jgi:hypothetical protein
MSPCSRVCEKIKRVLRSLAVAASMRRPSLSSPNCFLVVKPQRPTADQREAYLVRSPRTVTPDQREAHLRQRFTLWGTVLIFGPVTTLVIATIGSAVPAPAPGSVWFSLRRLALLPFALSCWERFAPGASWGPQSRRVLPSQCRTDSFPFPATLVPPRPRSHPNSAWASHPLTL